MQPAVKQKAFETKKYFVTETQIFKSHVCETDDEHDAPLPVSLEKSNCKSKLHFV